MSTALRTRPGPSGALRSRRGTGPGRPRWHRFAPAVLLVSTAALYLWGLSRSGWANAFYSAAAQAGSRNATAWFFGSSDAANAITVDKIPAALWVTGLAVRIFGFSSWSVLLPQALMGVASVGLLHAAVRRAAGPAAGLVAGAAFALTPVAVMIFRFNNPDALLVLLLVGAAYATQRAVERGATRWLALAGALVGLGFLAKMMQAFLVLPALTAVWLLAAPVGRGRRIRDLLLAGVALLVTAGWWVLVVELWPAGSRPYIGGSQHDSALEMILGYNGFGRLTGAETGSFGTGWGETGLTRLFDPDLGAEAAWLLPAALVLLAGLLWRTRRAPRTDPLRAATVLWGGWLLVTGLTFSYMAGIIHPYYTVALAPATAALVGIGATALRGDRRSRYVLAAALALTATCAYALLSRITWQPWLTWTAPAVTLAAAAAVLGVHRMPRAATTAVAAVALLGGAAGPAAYALATAAAPLTGSIPVSGPAGLRGGTGAHGPQGGLDDRGQGLASILEGHVPPAAVTTALRGDADRYTWAAAAVGSNNAAGYQLASGLPVLALGGYNTTDPAPTLEQFQALVAAHRVHWFVGGSPVVKYGRAGTEVTRIAAWVQATYPVVVVDGTPLYDLTP